MIIYRNIGGEISVILGGKLVGSIKKESGGYRYHVHNSKHKGELFSDLKECKKSLEM